MQLVHVHSKIYIITDISISSRNENLLEPEDLSSNFIKIRMAQVVSQHLTDTDSSESKHFGSLSLLHQFDSLATRLATEQHSPKLAFVFGETTQAFERYLFLIGCHLIMTHGFGFEETCLALDKVHTHTRRCVDSTKDWLRSLCCAKCLDWIDFRVTPKNVVNSFEFDKIIHDERCLISSLESLVLIGEVRCLGWH